MTVSLIYSDSSEAVHGCAHGCNLDGFAENSSQFKLSDDMTRMVS